MIEIGEPKMLDNAMEHHRLFRPKISKVLETIRRHSLTLIPSLRH